MLDRLKKIFLFIFLFLCFLFSDLIYLVFLKFMSIDYKSLSYNFQVLCTIISSLVLIIVMSIIYRKYLIIKFKDYKVNFKKYFDIGFKYWFIGLTIMWGANMLIANFSPIHEANNEALVQETLKNAPILTFISATFLAPFIEELLFRKSFGDIFKNKKIMIIMSALLFGALHVVFSLKTPWDLLYIIPYGALGGAFAYCLSETDNVFVPITFHTIHNGILTLLSIIITLIFKVI